MYLVKNKTLCDTEGNVLITEVNEILLTEDLIEDYLTKEDISSAIRSPYIIPIYKLLLLNPDETPKEDVTDFIDGDKITYSHEYKTGQCRSTSVTMDNKNGEWLPNPVSGKNWAGTKFMLYTGILYRNTVFWYPCGVYYISNPTINASDESVSLELVDKFAMLDGTLGGTIESDYQINVNDLVCDSIDSILRLDVGNGDKFDEKPFLYPIKFKDEKTPYTLKKSPESNMGEMITELTEMLSGEIAYNEEGFLEMNSSDELMQITEKPVVLHITDEDIDMNSVTINTDYRKIINKVTVVGANINGNICSYTATNDNPASPSSIHFTPINFQYVSDDNIYSDELCKERADYELQKASFLSLSTTLPLVIWCPFIKAGQLIMWTSEKYGFKGEKFLVNSVSMTGDGNISLSVANIKELPFNG